MSTLNKLQTSLLLFIVVCPCSFCTEKQGHSYQFSLW